MNDLHDYAHNDGQGTKAAPNQQPTQIVPPGKQNKNNWNFAAFLLALKADSRDVQKWFIRQFQRQMQSIVHKKSLFHPGGHQEWESVTGEILAREIGKFCNFSADEIREKRANNAFAYLYEALANGAIDEVRKLVCRPKEVSYDTERLTFIADRLAHRIPNPDKVLERHELISLILATREKYAHSRGVRTVLHVLAQLLGNPQAIEGTKYRASIVKAVAESAGVSLTHARTYLRQFRDLVKTEEPLRAIRDELVFLASDPISLCGSLPEGSVRPRGGD